MLRGHAKLCVELGAGLSTLVLGRIIREQDLDCKLLSVEHNGPYAARARKAVEEEASPRSWPLSRLRSILSRWKATTGSDTARKRGRNRRTRSILCWSTVRGSTSIRRFAPRRRPRYAVGYRLERSSSLMTPAGPRSDEPFPVGRNCSRAVWLSTATPAAESESSGAPTSG